MMIARSLLGLAVALAGCTAASAAEPFSPERYFAGRTRSEGVVAGIDGTVEDRITGTTEGRRTRDGVTTFEQTIRSQDGTVKRRTWRIAPTGPGTISATATDVVGTATGTVSGDTLHISYVVRTSPANPLADVEFEQWLTLQPDGRTVFNHSEVRKLGFLVRTVTERFVRAGRS